MKERVIEHWLTKATERTFQVPFAYMLASRGFTVLHVTRHCAMELGKDVIAVDSEGLVCAFQLKTGDLNKSKWRDIYSQIQELLESTVIHPSIPSTSDYQSYLVINGKIEEEAQIAIDASNRNWVSRGFRPLKTIVGSQLEKWASDLGTSLWPTEIREMKDVLELFLNDGLSLFPKEKYARIIQTMLPYNYTKNNKKPSMAARNRATSSASLLTSIVLSNFSKNENFVAEFEAWTIYLSYVFSIVDRWSTSQQSYSNEINIAKTAIEHALINLVDEIRERKHFVEGDASVDAPYYRIRITWVIGILSAFGIKRRIESQKDDELDNTIKTFVLDHITEMVIWGESAIPSYLSVFWYLKKIGKYTSANHFLYGVINSIVVGHSNEEKYIANPYYQAIDLIPYMLDDQLAEVCPLPYRVSTKPFEDNSKGISYTLESLLDIIVRENWRLHFKVIWPSASRIMSRKFRYKKTWHYYWWRCGEEGQEVVTLRHPTQSWQKLRKDTSDVSGNILPKSMKESPYYVLYHLLVFPHRISPSVIRWLDHQIRGV